MSITKWKIFWNTGAQVIGRLVGAGTTFVVSLVIARAFGAQGYGDFAKITTYVALFYLLADFGMNAVYLRKAHELNESETNETNRNAWRELLGVRVVSSIVLMFLALAILVFLPQGVGQGYTAAVRLGIIVFLPTILFQAIITTANAAFQQRLRYDFSAVAIVVGSLVTIASVWTLVRIGAIGAVVGIEIGTLVTAGTSIFFVKKLSNMLHLTITRSALLSYFTQSLPLGLTLVFNLIYFRADHLILTLSRSTAEVGIYGLAYKVFEFPMAVPTFFMNSVYPLMVQEIRDKQKVISQKFTRFIKRSFFVLLITSLLSLFTLWMAAPLLSTIRPEFVQSVGALRVLSLGLPFFFLTSLTMWTMIALKRQKLLALIYGSSMIVNVFLNVWLVPQHGYMAAAWITVVSETLVLFASGAFVLRYL
ncbi:oligosaccharide flippase family protein [Candidatus Gottesmanbacteria bacterium]|nr:oligosaccharide flippase family protein [Candidatus Gottesmanbacteria bacterium]